MDLPCAGPAGGVGHVLPPGGTSDHLVGHFVDSVGHFVDFVDVVDHLLIMLVISLLRRAWMTLVILLLRRRLDDGHCCGHFGAFFRTCVGSARNRDARVGRAAGVP